MKRVLFLLCLAAMTVPVRAADDVEPLTCKKGKLLYQSDFSDAKLPKGWYVNTGKVVPADKSLLASQKASDMHVGAMRYHQDFQDVVISVTFRFEGATTFDLGFDPAPGELKKKGHLYSVIIKPTEWTIEEHRDKASDTSKNIPQAAAKAKFEQNKTYTLLLEAKGDQAVAQIAGFEPLKAKSKDFAVKKPGLVFRYGGKDDQNVRILDVKVWQAE